MIYCTRCGKQNPSDTSYCGSCGNLMESKQPSHLHRTHIESYATMQQISLGTKVGIALLCFLFPMIGIIVGLVLINDSDPYKKYTGRIWLNIGIGTFILSTLFTCLLIILFMAR